MGVSLFHASRHHEWGLPILDALVRHVCVEVRQLDDLLHTMKTMEGSDVPRSDTDSTEKLVRCLMHMWSILYVISVICYLMCICVYTSYHCELVVGLRERSCTLLEVWGGWELGC